jgi:hypothetical protein
MDFDAALEGLGAKSRGHLAVLARKSLWTRFRFCDTPRLTGLLSTAREFATGPARNDPGRSIWEEM